jgi:hypothetical protein
MIETRDEWCDGKDCYRCFMDWILWGEIYLEKTDNGLIHISPANVIRRVRTAEGREEVYRGRNT